MALQARVPKLNHQGHVHGACNVSASRLSHHAGRTVADEQQSTSPSEQLSLEQLQIRRAYLQVSSEGHQHGAQGLPLLLAAVVQPLRTA